MNWRLLLVYLCSILLLFFSQQKVSLEPSTPNSKFLNQLEKKLTSRFKSPQEAQLLLAFTTGHKKRLPQKIQQTYRDLCLCHLFTPSGIHLSAIFGLLIIFFSKRKRKWPLITLQVGLSLSLFLLPGFYSLKRISCLRLFQLLTIKKISLFTSFLMVFAGDFFIGNYSLSPISYCYSFLFLGTILASIDSDKLLLPFALMGAQLIVSFFNQTPLCLIAPLIGFTLTALFAPLFIIYFSTLFLSLLTPLFIYKYPIVLYHYLVNIGHKFSTLFPTIFPTASILFLILLLMTPIKSNIKRCFFVIILLLQSPLLLNLPKNSNKDPYQWDWIDKSTILSIKRYYRGYRIDYASGYRCYYQHANWFYFENCY